MGPIGVVLDTNVLVSALGFGGTPLEAVLRTFEEDVQLLASEATLGELERVMAYDELPFTAADRSEFLAILRREAQIMDPEGTVEVCRDPDDDKFLEVALSGDGTYVVSGDEDLRAVGDYEGITVLSPAAFVSKTA